MPPRKKSATPELVKHSRELRRLTQQERQGSPLQGPPARGGSSARLSELCRQSDELVRKSHEIRDQLGKSGMPPEWDHLLHETKAAQVTFLQAEVNTGITLARIALKARDGGKISRNTRSARKAYDTLRAYLAAVPPKTPGLDGIRKKMIILKDLLEKLRAKR